MFTGIVLMALGAIAIVVLFMRWYAHHQEMKAMEANYKKLTETSSSARDTLTHSTFFAGPTYPNRVGYARNAGATAVPPTPRDNSSDMLMAGALGYMIGSSGNSHASGRTEESMPAFSGGGGGDSGGAGASSSWDDSSSRSSDSSSNSCGSSYSSDSSSSSSSYSSSDSGSSSSDSGSSGGGSSD